MKSDSSLQAMLQIPAAPRSGSSTTIAPRNSCFSTSIILKALVFIHPCCNCDVGTVKRPKLWDTYIYLPSGVIQIPRKALLPLASLMSFTLVKSSILMTETQAAT